MDDAAALQIRVSGRLAGSLEPVFDHRFNLPGAPDEEAIFDRFRAALGALPPAAPGVGIAVFYVASEAAERVRVHTWSLGASVSVGAVENALADVVVAEKLSFADA